jgi:predicted  nucleic acid-binding Zn-ribbon protein
LRHSSATFYAIKLNRQELCYRYGWRFSSDMPDVFISRAGMVSEQLDEKFTHTELSSLKNEVTELREQERIKQDQIQGLQNKMHNMVRHLEQVAELLKLTSDPTLIETALARVRQSHRKA